MGSQKEQSTADCQMVRGRRQECSADGEAVSTIQVLQQLEQAKNPHRFPLDIGLCVSVLKNADGVSIHIIALTLTIWTQKKLLAWIP